MSNKKDAALSIKKLTPVLIVEAIEPSLSFWEERLGFKRTIEVPLGSHLGFVALEYSGIEVMMQTQQSAMADLPQAPRRAESAGLYFEVKDLSEIERALEGLKWILRRRAPYGSEELFLQEPGGHLIGFAQHPSRS